MRKFFLLLTILTGYCSHAQDTVKVASLLTPEQQAEADYNSGIERLKSNDFVTAIDFFTKSIANKPTFDKALYNRAVALTQVKRYAEAYADINNAIRISPQNPETYFTKSLIFFAENKKDSQTVALNKCLAIKYGHAEANYYKGLLQYEAGEYKAAVSCYDKAILSNGNYAYAYNDRGSAKRALKDYAGAISDYEKAISIDNKQAFVYNNLGSAYRENKDYTKAADAYSKALQMNDKYIIALTNRGAARLESGNINGAKADFEEALKKEPNNSSACNGLASVYIKQREYQKAKDMATKAIQNNGKNGPAYYNRGIARQMLREDEGSCADWKKALELGVSAAKLFINSDCGE